MANDYNIVYVFFMLQTFEISEIFNDIHMK